jgi:tRNA (cmo5U34)-methyltransferase
MGSNHMAINAYNNMGRAQKYNSLKGFDPARKERMLDVALGLLVDLTPTGASLLELGAGTGLFTRKLHESGHFGKIYVTDGAPAMLDIARAQLADLSGMLFFDILDFSVAWSDRYGKNNIDAVTSSMAIHHVEDKQRLFKEVFQVLVPGGSFVFADHLAGSSEQVDRLIGHERGRVKMRAQGSDSLNDQATLDAFLEQDALNQAAEGNRCESLAQNLAYLAGAGFHNIDCLWRDYWLAVFVAKKLA